MATFLTTPRMNPALRARVERAVSHRRRAKEAAARLGLKGTFAESRKIPLARVLPVLLFVLVGLLGTGAYMYGKRLLEEDRAALLGSLPEKRAGMPPGHERFLGVVDHRITEIAADTAPPDTVDASLNTPEGLDAWLKRPAVYVHGSAADMRDAAKLDEVAATSIKDPFLVCLRHPPKSASEADLLAKVKGVYFAGAKVEDETANVHRLADAREGLAVLGPAFEESVRAAEDRRRVAKLRHDLDAAPIERAKKAVGASVLIVVADIQAQTGTREARVTLVDLTSGNVLLRARPKIDHQGRTAASAFYEAEVDGCALALAVRRGLSPDVGHTAP
ncbi:MAG: hypothetical protein U0441_30115 [Polyangiaceae bacterium]